jgi:hypothetical protein
MLKEKYLVWTLSYWSSYHCFEQRVRKRYLDSNVFTSASVEHGDPSLKVREIIQSESEMCTQPLWMSSMPQIKKTSSYKCGSTDALFPNYSTERTHLQELLTVSTNVLNTCFGTSCDGLPKPFKDRRIISDTLAGVHIVLVKCIHVVKRN